MQQVEFRLPAFDDGRVPPTRPRRRLLVVGVAALMALAGLTVALVLGTLGYDFRRERMHDTRLRRVLVQTPTVYQVTEGLKEKAPLVAIVETDEDLRRAVERFGGTKADAILEAANRWPQLRVFDASDMMYFVFFDEHDIMQAYVIVSREGSP